MRDDQQKPKVIGYKVEAGISSDFRRRFKTKWGADRYLEKIEAKLTEANKVCDGEIWTSIELIYETRWDCPTARLAAAKINTNEARPVV